MTLAKIREYTHYHSFMHCHREKLSLSSREFSKAKCLVEFLPFFMKREREWKVAVSQLFDFPSEVFRIHTPYDFFLCGHINVVRKQYGVKSTEPRNEKGASFLLSFFQPLSSSKHTHNIILSGGKCRREKLHRGKSQVGKIFCVIFSWMMKYFLKDFKFI